MPAERLPMRKLREIFRLPIDSLVFRTGLDASGNYGNVIPGTVLGMALLISEETDIDYVVAQQALFAAGDDDVLWFSVQEGDLCGDVAPDEVLSAAPTALAELASSCAEQTASERRTSLEELRAVVGAVDYAVCFD